MRLERNLKRVIIVTLHTELNAWKNTQDPFSFARVTFSQFIKVAKVNAFELFILKVQKLNQKKKKVNALK